MRRVSLSALLLVLNANAPPQAAPKPAVAAANDGAALMKAAEALMLTDAAAAAAKVQASRAAYARSHGEQSPEVALADYRLALVRALGGDRAGQLRPMAEAAQRYAARARTPEQRTGGAQALIVAASFTMNSSEVALTDTLTASGTAMLAEPGLARTTDLAEAYRVLGDVYVFQNRHAQALPWIERAAALYQDLDPDSPALVYALARMGSALQSLSRSTEALAVLRRAVAEADRGDHNDPTVPMSALRSLGNYYWRVGQIDLALPMLERALVEAEKLPPGFPYAGGLLRDLMNALLDEDRFAEARVYAEKSAERTRATMGAKSYMYASAVLVLARLDTRDGRFDAAARRIDEVDAVFADGMATANNRRFEALEARGALYAATGRAAEAAGLYDRARAMLADRPVDDPDRIDVAAGSAAARLAAARIDDEAWGVARGAADGLTTRIIQQGAGLGLLDTARSRADRVYATALDAAWARGAAN